MSISVQDIIVQTVADYNRPDHNYTGWNVWTWGDGSSAVVQFTSDDEAGGKVAEISSKDVLQVL